MPTYCMAYNNNFYITHSRAWGPTIVLGKQVNVNAFVIKLVLTYFWIHKMQMLIRIIKLQKFLKWKGKAANRKKINNYQKE